MLKLHDVVLQLHPVRHRSERVGVFMGPARLMAESERRLITAASGDNADEVLVARRLLDNAFLYRRWEFEHDLMLRHCFADCQSINVMTLLSASLALIHRMGLFQFLKDHSMSTGQRASLVRRISGHSDHERVIIREHGNYIRSAASLLCVGHLGTAVLKNTTFGSPLLEYEELYSDYFDLLCRLTMTREGDPFFAYHRGLVSTMKRRLDLRRSILLRCVLRERDAASADSPLH